MKHIRGGLRRYVFAEDVPENTKAPLIGGAFSFWFACLPEWEGATASTMGKSERRSIVEPRDVGKWGEEATNSSSTTQSCRSAIDAFADCVVRSIYFGLVANSYNQPSETGSKSILK